MAILQYKGNSERFIERLYSFDIGKAKTTVPSFKKLPDKLSIPAAFSELVSLSNFKTLSSEVGDTFGFLYSEIFIVSQN